MPSHRFSLTSVLPKSISEQVRLDKRTVRRQQVIRPRGGTTRRRDDQEEQAISSAEEIGRLLQECPRRAWA